MVHDIGDSSFLCVVGAAQSVRGRGQHFALSADHTWTGSKSKKECFSTSALFAVTPVASTVNNARRAEDAEQRKGREVSATRKQQPRVN
jgi:hypothetical protein